MSKGQKTTTNPLGIRMVKKLVSIPPDLLHSIKLIQDETNKNFSVICREALRAYVTNYHMRGSSDSQN